MWTKLSQYATGTNATPELYRKLVDFARRQGYRHRERQPYSFILNESSHASSTFRVPKSGCIEFNSMSKSHDMRAGVSHACRSIADFVQWILKVKSTSTAVCSVPCKTGRPPLPGSREDWYDANQRELPSTAPMAGEIIACLGCTY